MEHLTDTKPSAEQITQAELSAKLNDVVKDVPEAVERAEQIQESVNELINSFPLEIGFYERPENVFLLAAIGDRLSQAKTIEDKEFVHDAFVMLGNRYNNDLNTMFQDSRSELPAASPEQQQLAYDAYTNRQVTAELSAALPELLKEVRGRLGVTPETEDKFEVRVLNIAHRDSVGGIAKNQDKVDYFHHKEWEQGLLENSEKFADSLNDGKPPIAWVASVNGNQVLCIDLPTAELMLDPTLHSSQSLPESELAERIKRTRSLLEHEYTHTQGGLNADKENFFGIALEEFRAEHFSGNMNGYGATKLFLADVDTVTGIDFKKILDASPKGGTAHELYVAVANHIGMQAALELLMTVPAEYATATEASFVRATQESLGGYDGFITRQLQTELAMSRSAEIEKTVNKRVEMVRPKDKEWIIGYWEQQGNSVFAGMVRDKLRKVA